MPSWLCVAEFVASAVQCLDGRRLDAAVVGRALDIRTPINDVRSLSPGRDGDDVGLGITQREAAKRIPTFLKQLNCELHFRHVPFNTIPFQMYDRALEDAESRGAFVGIGYNFSRLVGESGTQRHVSQIRSSGKRALIVDKDLDPPYGIRDVSWDTVAAATVDVSGGYWLIGTHESVALGLALPYKGDGT